MGVLHIVQYSLPEIVSGYTIRTQAIVHQQMALGLAPRVLTSPRHPLARPPGQASPDEEEVEGIPHYRCPPERRGGSVWLRDSRRVGALAAGIAQIIRSQRDIRLLHAHSPVLCGMAALRAGRPLGLPVVYEVRGLWEEAMRGRGPLLSWWPRYRLAQKVETRVCRAAGAVVAISEGLRQDLATRGVPMSRLHVVGNGVDLERFAPRHPPAEWRASHGVGQGELILYLGALRSYEGVHLLLDAFPLIRNARPEAHLVIIGDGETRTQLAAQVGNLRPPAANHIHLLPAVPHAETPEWYAAADLVVYPRLSTRATELVTPLKPLEAMAMGKAIVASDVGGLKELFGGSPRWAEAQPPALLFPAGSVTALAQACVELLADKGRRARLGTAARQIACEQYDWRTVVARYTDVYGPL